MIEHSSYFNVMRFAGSMIALERYFIYWSTTTRALEELIVFADEIALPSITFLSLASDLWQCRCG
jgi:hypothetical protein